MRTIWGCEENGRALVNCWRLHTRDEIRCSEVCIYRISPVGLEIGIIRFFIHRTAYVVVRVSWILRKYIWNWTGLEQHLEFEKTSTNLV